MQFRVGHSAANSGDLDHEGADAREALECRRRHSEHSPLHFESLTKLQHKTHLPDLGTGDRRSPGWQCCQGATSSALHDPCRPAPSRRIGHILERCRQRPQSPMHFGGRADFDVADRRPGEVSATEDQRGAHSMAGRAEPRMPRAPPRAHRPGKKTKRPPCRYACSQISRMTRREPPASYPRQSRTGSLYERFASLPQSTRVHEFRATAMTASRRWSRPPARRGSARAGPRSEPPQCRDQPWFA